MITDKALEKVINDNSVALNAGDKKTRDRFGYLIAELYSDTAYENHTVEALIEFNNELDVLIPIMEKYFVAMTAIAESVIENR